MPPDDHRRMITAELEFTVERRLVRPAVSSPDRVKHFDGDRAAAGGPDRHPDRPGSIMDGDRLRQTIQTLGLDLGRFYDMAFGKTIEVGPDRRGWAAQVFDQRGVGGENLIRAFVGRWVNACDTHSWRRSVSGPRGFAWIWRRLFSQHTLIALK